jgi:hypothetical protein
MAMDLPLIVPSAWQVAEVTSCELWHDVYNGVATCAVLLKDEC